LPLNSQDLKEQDPKDFPNIIFDYGGVIINIDVEETIRSFKDLLPRNTIDFQKIIESSDAFKALEKGEITESNFLDQFNQLLNANISWNKFEPAWNAMIGDLPVSRLNVLEEISGSHRIFLLSNTNSIHLRRVSEVVRETIGTDSIDHYFEMAYYSNQLGLRKPNTDIYEFVLKDQNLNPKDTIFLDDNIHNLKGASDAGLAVCHITEEWGITEIF
jgi:glucose-1-phosphatase